MRASAAALEGAGFEVVRFDFPKREYRMPVLKDCIAAVAAEVPKAKKLILGGRSMGGRAASMLAADGFACDGLLLLSYPLHPVDKPDKLRDAHLAAIRVPVLCFNGTKDPLCRRDRMEPILKTLAWRMHWLEGATHSFRARDYPVIAEASRDWLAHLG
jgi:predicted alpha/beta-hydrolase family hydrolase